MSSTKKKKRSVFSVLVVIVLLLTIASTILANVFFSGNMIPQAAGYYLYLQEDADMLPDVPEKSLVIAKNSDTVSLSAGNKVLCYLTNGSVALRLIYLINLNEDNSTSYFVGTPEEQGSEPAIPKDSIFGVCIWSSTQLYQYVKFATSVNGLLALLVLPCVILIVMLLVKILKSNHEENEIRIEPEEEPLLFEDPGPSRKPKSVSQVDVPQEPLLIPESIPQSEKSFETEKTPIQENSSYQKSKQGRTGKFDVPDMEQPAKKQEVIPPNFEAKTSEETPVQYIQKEPPAQPTIRNQPFQPYQPPTQGMLVPPPPVQSVQMPQPPVVPAPPQMQQPVPPVPVVDISKVQPVESTVQTPEQIRSAALERETARVRQNRKETSPNIDDILMASQMKEEIRSSTFRSNSEIARTDSIDDLIAVLEKKKNNL